MASKIFRAYSHALSLQPLLVQSGTAATLYAIGDVMAQATTAAVSPEKDKAWDWQRTVMMTSIGGCALGPSMAIWYRFLQRRIQLRSHTYSVLARVFVDQTVFAPASIAGLYYLTELLQTTQTRLKDRISKAEQKLRESFVPVLQRNYILWPAVSFVNFFYVPLQYRLLVSNTVAIFWSAFLSLSVNK